MLCDYLPVSNLAPRILLISNLITAILPVGNLLIGNLFDYRYINIYGISGKNCGYPLV